jgi:hypothetical protein
MTELGTAGSVKTRRGVERLSPAVTLDTTPIVTGETAPPPPGTGTAPAPDIPAGDVRGPGASTGDPCAGLDYVGACDGMTARWCEGGQPMQRDCQSLGQTCAWIDAQIGFYCASLAMTGMAPAPPGPGSSPGTPTTNVPSNNPPPVTGSSAPQGTATGAANDQQYCVDVINQYRARTGLAPLQRSSALEQFATEGARYNASAGPHAYFSMQGGGGVAWAENEIPGWQMQGSVRDVIQQGTDMMYNEGPGGGHHDNIVGNYRSVGCGIHQQFGQVWVIQDFGN